MQKQNRALWSPLVSMHAEVREVKESPNLRYKNHLIPVAQ